MPWQTVGHDRAVRVLSQALNENRMPHALLVTGPPEIGKMSLALDLARALNCVGDGPPCGGCGQCQRVTAKLHPDVRAIGLETDGASGRERTAISIDQVREMQRDASLKPYEGRFRVFVFDGAELLSVEAANSLLKTLEEPPDQVVMILLASDAAAVLATINSRCRRLDLRPVSVKTISDHLYRLFTTDRGVAEEVARLSRGRMGWAIRATKEPELLQAVTDTLDAIEEMVDSPLEARFQCAEGIARRFVDNRARVLEELDLWLGWWRDVMVISQGRSELVAYAARLPKLQAIAEEIQTAQVAASVRAVQRTKELLQKNVNPRLAAEEMMLAVPEVTIAETSSTG